MTIMKAIVNGRLILKDRIEDNKVLIFDEKIIAIEDNVSSLLGLEIIDAAGSFVSPGFIDIHMHGAFGYDVMEGSREALDNISKGLIRSGVTGFLPTTITMEWNKISRALENIREYVSTRRIGAKVLGAHLEGPFINPARKGAHDERYIIKPDYEKIKDYIDIIKLITIAPEMDCNLDFIRKASGHKHMSISMGHSDASYEVAMDAIKAGIKSTTHLYNAMSPLNHRNPGVVGAALDSDVYCELIADNIHIHPAIYKIAAAVKGRGKLILITDSINAACMKDGVYDLGGQNVVVQEGSARLSNGTLAGSVLRMNEAVRNFKENTGLSLPEVVRMASLNPAVLLGLDSEIGSIEPGKRADLVIFNENMDILVTIIDGEL